MTVIEQNKNRKLFQIAKELNLAHTTLMEFLNSQGYDTPKKHLSVVSQEMYEEIIKKFDLNRWKKHQEKISAEKETGIKRVSEDLRVRELDRILTEVEPEEIEVKDRRAKAPTPPEPAEIPEIEEVVIRGEETSEEAIEEIAAAVAPKKAEETEVIEEAAKEEKRVEAKEKPVEGRIEEELKRAKEVPPEPVTEKPEVEEAEEKAHEMQSVNEVVEEAIKLARSKQKARPKVEEKEKAKETRGEKETEEEEEAKDKKRRRRRRKKPRRPEAPSPAAVDIEKEKRAKKGKKKPKEETKEEEAPSRKKRRKTKRKKVDAEEVAASIKQTLAQIEDRGKAKKKKRRYHEEEVVEEEGNILRVTEFISAQELANLLDFEVTKIIAKAMEMGLLISINQRLDKDTIVLLADEFGFSIEFLSSFEEEVEEEEEEIEAKPLPRPPVVTVMGHVDHGKTSLLDFIRRSNIIAGESGGITQHIGAYKVKFNDRYITFLDTPGHEAFTAMRARGAQVTDIVVLVIAADDQVMPQTIEAIDHARAAGVPMIIAINKIDKPNALPDRVRQQLADRGILVEEWGGKFQCAEISAKYGQGVEKLMEEIVLLADLSDLKAPYDCRSKGVIIDAKLDKGRGSIATVLIQRGKLDVGDNFVCGQHFGKVRALLDERGGVIDQAYPSEPVQVLGFHGTPQAGDTFMEIASEREAKNISFRRQQLYREQSFRQIRMITLDQISKQIKEGEVSHLPLLIKGDVHGSVEALSDSVMKLQNEEVTVEVIHKGVGAITESDVLLAAASGAIIIGFHVHANKNARELAVRERVEIKSYRIIYDVIEDVKKALEGMLKPAISEEIVGEIEIRDIFKISTVGTIAGCYVSEGKIERNSKVKVYRGGVEIADSEIDTLKRFKDDVKEVAEGYECGVKIKNFADVKVGDVLQVYKLIETKRTLSA